MTGPVGPARAAVLLARHELRLAARRGENVLVTLVIPPAVLVFFSRTGLVPGIAGRPVDYLLPGVLALAIIAGGLVNLGIATAYDRQYGVLRRLGVSPVGRPTVVAARGLGLLAIEVVQVAVLLAIASIVLDWQPAATLVPAMVLIGAVLGTAAFAGLGLLLAGTLRADATLALANGLFLGLLMVGGIVLPLDHLAPPLAALGSILPAAPLADLLRIGFGGPGDPTLPTLVLGGWAVATVGLAARTFRWD